MNRPDRISYYFKKEKNILSVITVTGILYNVGMIAGPWFEGQLAQTLFEIITGKKHFYDMVIMAVLSVVIIGFVQEMRFLKRLYVRKFANNVNRNMKSILYTGLVHKSMIQIEQETAGNLMTKAISDVDACSEGIRKFTTEVFDTGVVMLSYLVMLFSYDVRLALISCIFPPFAYIFAEKLKVWVHSCNAEYKKSAGRLNEATLDRINTAVTYRVFGQEENRDAAYEKKLKDYEKKAVRANLWSGSMQPVYQIISMMSVVLIIWLGGKNVTGTGWTSWNIAAFTTFLSCFTKMAVKSSKAAKLFNAVQKAQVSWGRILPLLNKCEDENIVEKFEQGNIEVCDVSFNYPGMGKIFEHITFTLKPGEIIGITGPVASGKSTLGKIFLCEYPYDGRILFNGREISELVGEHSFFVSYMGHKPELLSDTVENNILLGRQCDVHEYLRAACIEEEVEEMPQGIKTQVGKRGTRLSGGQQDRIAFARTLCHKRPLLILDDPFSAVDYNTEQTLFKNLKKYTDNSAVIFISHRLNLFPKFNKILWLENGEGIIGSHEQFMKENDEYRTLFDIQSGVLSRNDRK